MTNHLIEAPSRPIRKIYRRGRQVPHPTTVSTRRPANADGLIDAELVDLAKTAIGAEYELMPEQSARLRGQTVGGSRMTEDRHRASRTYARGGRKPDR
jgi:hypothetical protein